MFIIDRIIKVISLMESSGNVFGGYFFFSCFRIFLNNFVEGNLYFLRKVKGECRFYNVGNVVFWD